MAEMIGLTNSVTLEWMELAVRCKLLGKSVDEARDIINENISHTIKSPDNIRKKRDIVLNMWYRPEDWFLEACTKAAQNLPADERIGVHWALLLKRYQVFYDLCVVIGGLFEYREDITLGQIRTRIFEKWGARDTLQNCLSKNIQTFKELKSIVATDMPGVYNRNIMILNITSILQLLCAAIIERSGRKYITWEELIQHFALFTFNIENLTQADMASCEWLCLERMGEDVVIRLFVKAIHIDYCFYNYFIHIKAAQIPVYSHSPRNTAFSCRRLRYCPRWYALCRSRSIRRYRHGPYRLCCPNQRR